MKCDRCGYDRTDDDYNPGIGMKTILHVGGGTEGNLAHLCKLCYNEVLPDIKLACTAPKVDWTRGGTDAKKSNSNL